MLITTGGVLVRTRVSEIREMGRATQGVTLIDVDEGTAVGRAAGCRGGAMRWTIRSADGRSGCDGWRPPPMARWASDG
jgi:DNA gyrase subunit A